MVINLSQGLRDRMNCIECDKDSQRINRACLAEGRKNTGRDSCADRQSLLYSTRER
jgi:hypothetical protein